TVVEDNNLNMQIAGLRRVLDDQRAEGSCIQTVSGRGYRFVLPVSRGEPPSAPMASSSYAGAPGTELNGASASTTLGSSGARSPRRQIAAALGGVLIVASLLLIAGGLWWDWSSLRAPRTASQSAHPTLSRLSIVVLPFANLSNDPEQRYFVDGITEDLTTDLSRIQDMFVISHS